MKLNELKDKLSFASFTLNSKKNELARIKINTFSYNPRVTELMFEINTIEEEIKKIEKEMEGLTSE